MSVFKLYAVSPSTLTWEKVKTKCNVSLPQK